MYVMLILSKALTSYTGLKGKVCFWCILYKSSFNMIVPLPFGGLIDLFLCWSRKCALYGLRIRKTKNRLYLSSGYSWLGWSLFCNFWNLHFSPSNCVPLCKKTYLAKYKFNWTIFRGSSMTLKFRIILISSRQIRILLCVTSIENIVLLL